MLDVHVEKQVRVLRECRFRVPANGDDSHLKAGNRWQNPDHLFRLPACAQSKHHVAIGNYPEVAMQRVRRIEHHSRRPGAGKGGRDLCPNMSGLADSDYNHLPPRVDRLPDQFNGSREIFVQTLPQPLELKNFYVQDAFGLFKVIHRSI